MSLQLLNPKVIIRKTYNTIMSFIEHRQQLRDKARREKRSQIAIEHLTRSALHSTEPGVTAEHVSDEDIVVSITTYRERYQDVFLAIESIMQGTVKPNRIVLYVSEELSNEPIPVELQHQMKRGLEIEFVKDIRSYTKLIYALKQFPDAAIITVDDDVMYDSYTLEQLISCHHLHPDAICANDIMLIPSDYSKSHLIFDKWEHARKCNVPYSAFIFQGYGGTLYPPRSLAAEVNNERVFMDICATSDDVWFSAMAMINGTRCVLANSISPMYRFAFNESVQQTALNITNSKGDNDRNILSVFAKYHLPITHNHLPSLPLGGVGGGSYMPSPFISIIIPMYNTEEYIVRCLDSIAQQSYSGKIQCIVVDDASTDGSVEAYKRYVSHNTSKVEFQLMQHTTNRKQGAARNTGMDKAQGDYILFVDSDDTIPANTLQQLTDTLAKYPDADMVQCGMEVVSQNKNDISKWADCKSWKEPNLQYTDNREWIVTTCAEELDMIPICPVCKLFSLRFIRQNDIRFVEDMFYEDDVLLFLLAKKLQRVAFCHHNLYHYNIRNNSTTGGGNIKYVKYLKQMWLERLNILDHNFRPLPLLKRMVQETTYYYNRTTSLQVKKMIVSIKLRIMCKAPLSLKLNILAWLIIKPFLPPKRIPQTEHFLFIP